MSVAATDLVRDMTALVLTFNEAPNIERTLEAVKWAQRILVVDSGSTDATLDIVARYPQARVVTRPFDTFANQCNFGLSQISSEWVLSLDADFNLLNSGDGLVIAALYVGYAGVNVHFFAHQLGCLSEQYV